MISHFHFNFEMANQSNTQLHHAPAIFNVEPTSFEDWNRSDQYHNSFLIPKDDVLDAVLVNNENRGLPCIDVSRAQAKLLNLLARSIGAKRILEVGTLGG